MPARATFPRPFRFALPLLLAGLLAGAAKAQDTGSIEARLLAVGAPIAGVAVQVRPSTGAGSDQWVDDPGVVVGTSDARGIVRFAGLAPGRYHVIGHCGGLPGDHIAGNIVTKVEVRPGATVNATLTLRRGGRIVGRVMQGERGLSGVSVRSELGEPFPSTCPTLETRHPGPDGRFAVGRVPLGMSIAVKARRALGTGDLEVWKTFTLAQAETVTGTWNFPELDSAQLGSVRIGVRLEQGAPVEKGRLELTHIDSSWRYRVSAEVSDQDSLVVLSQLPPGEYTIRASAVPGVKTWWNASPESLVVAPGTRRDKIISARGREVLQDPPGEHVH